MGKLSKGIVGPCGEGHRQQKREKNQAMWRGHVEEMDSKRGGPGTADGPRNTERSELRGTNWPKRKTPTQGREA